MRKAISEWLDLYTVKVKPKTKKELDYDLCWNNCLIRSYSKYQVNHIADVIGFDSMEFRKALVSRGHEFISALPMKVYRTQVKNFSEWDTVSTLDIPFPYEAGLRHLPQYCPNCSKQIVIAQWRIWYKCLGCGAKWETIPSMKWSKQSVV